MLTKQANKVDCDAVLALLAGGDKSARELRLLMRDRTGDIVNSALNTLMRQGKVMHVRTTGEYHKV